MKIPIILVVDIPTAEQDPEFSITEWLAGFFRIKRALEPMSLNGIEYHFQQSMSITTENDIDKAANLAYEAYEVAEAALDTFIALKATYASSACASSLIDYQYDSQGRKYSN